MIQFLYFTDVSEDIVKFLQPSLAQGAFRYIMNDLMLQTTARYSVLSGACPNLGSNLVPRTSTYLAMNSALSDDARAHREGCVCHLWHACHRSAITALR